MHTFTIISTLVAVAFSGVLAAPGDEVSIVFARQNPAMPDAPAECQAICPTIQTFNACKTDLACTCSNATTQAMVDCGNCAIKYHNNYPNIDIDIYKSQLQAAINALVDTCTSLGHPIGPFSLTSSPTSRGSTASGSTPTGISSNPNGALSFYVVAETSALAAAAVVMAFVL